MPASISTRNSRTRPVSPISATLRGPLLLVFGAVLGYGLAVGDGLNAGASDRPETGAVAEDWHGNVMRSTWPH